MNPKNLIRKATTQDSEVIAQLAQLTFYESHGHSASKEEIDHYVNENLNETAIASELTQAENLYFVISHEDQDVGFLKILLNSPYTSIEEESVTKLERIYVLESHHGLRLGLALMEKAIDVAKENEQNGLWLYTWIENLRAVAFYKKKGFKVIDSADFKISETHSNPNHIMYLQFD